MMSQSVCANSPPSKVVISLAAHGVCCYDFQPSTSAEIVCIIDHSSSELRMQIIREPKVYDVCIVGSGAGGGMAAKVLTEAGAEVALLEAGGMWDTEKDSKMFAWPYDSPRRGG